MSLLKSIFKKKDKKNNLINTVDKQDKVKYDSLMSRIKYPYYALFLNTIFMMNMSREQKKLFFLNHFRNIVGTKTEDTTTVSNYLKTIFIGLIAVMVMYLMFDIAYKKYGDKVAFMSLHIATFFSLGIWGIIYMTDYGKHFGPLFSDDKLVEISKSSPTIAKVLANLHLGVIVGIMENIFPLFISLITSHVAKTMQECGLKKITKMAIVEMNSFSSTANLLVIIPSFLLVIRGIANSNQISEYSYQYFFFGLLLNCALIEIIDRRSKAFKLDQLEENEKTQGKAVGVIPAIKVVKDNKLVRGLFINNACYFFIISVLESIGSSLVNSFAEEHFRTIPYKTKTEVPKTLYQHLLPASFTKQTATTERYILQDEIRSLSYKDFGFHTLLARFAVHMPKSNPQEYTQYKSDIKFIISLLGMFLTYLGSISLPYIVDYVFKEEKDKTEENICRFAFKVIMLCTAIQVLLGIATYHELIHLPWTAVLISALLTGITRSIKYKLLDTFRDMTFVNQVKDKNEVILGKTVVDVYSPKLSKSVLMFAFTAISGELTEAIKGPTKYFNGTLDVGAFIILASSYYWYYTDQKLLAMLEKKNVNTNTTDKDIKIEDIDKDIK